MYRGVTLFSIIAILVSCGDALRCASSQMGQRSANPDSCASYFICQRNSSLTLHECPKGLHFNTNSQDCDYPSRVGCVKDMGVALFSSCDGCDCSVCCAGCATPTPTPNTTPCEDNPTPAPDTTPSKVSSTPDPTTPCEDNPTPAPNTTPCEDNPTPAPDTTPSKVSPTPDPTTPCEDNPTPAPNTTPCEDTPAPAPNTTPSKVSPTPAPTTPCEDNPTPAPNTTPSEVTPSAPATTPCDANSPSTKPAPTSEPSDKPTDNPSDNPSDKPSDKPTVKPTTPTVPAPEPSCDAQCCGKDNGYTSIMDGDCQKFIVCQDEKEVIMSCPNNLHYNSATGQCDFPENADCPWPNVPPSGPMAGPSGEYCESGGRCVGQRDGVSFGNKNSTCSADYVVCQCECEVTRSCGSPLMFNAQLGVCDWPNQFGCA